MKMLLLICTLLTFSCLTADNAELFTQHCKRLMHTQVAHPPLVICFSATPGMGKSYIAKQIEEKYQAVRISTDALRDMIRATDAGRRRDEALDTYLHYFMSHYDAPNRFLILDASIDRKSKQLFPLLEEKKIPFIVIRLDVPYEDAKARLIEREKENAGSYLKYMASWQADYEAFNYPDVIVVKNGKADTLSLEAFFARIDSLQK